MASTVSFTKTVDHARRPSARPITRMFPGGIMSVGRALAARPHDRLRPLGVQLQRTDQGCDVLHGLDRLELPLQVGHPPALQA